MNLHSNLSVTFETAVLERGRVVRRNIPSRNLLLDVGLDLLASTTFWDAFKYCALGSGTKPTKRDSGAITVSIAGEVATASAGFFEAADVGRLLKLDSGQEVRVTGYTSTTEVAVAGAVDDAASECTVWYVNETAHETQVKRTNTVTATNGTWLSPTATWERTFLFPEESAAITYREIGWAPASSGNLFGRALIPGGGDSLAPGQQYKVTVRLSASFNLAQVAVASAGTGVDIAGVSLMASSYRALHGDVSMSNPFYFYNDGNARMWEPSVWPAVKLINDAGWVIPAESADTAPAPSSYGSKGLTLDPYVSGSFRRTASATWAVTEGNGTIYGLSFGYQNWMHQFTTPFTKADTHKLTLSFEKSWGRVLVN
jgi:hypothetical protein